MGQLNNQRITNLQYLDLLKAFACSFSPLTLIDALQVFSVQPSNKYEKVDTQLWADLLSVLREAIL